jgi:hypothetical protein
VNVQDVELGDLHAANRASEVINRIEMLSHTESETAPREARELGSVEWQTDNCTVSRQELREFLHCAQEWHISCTPQRGIASLLDEDLVSLWDGKWVDVVLRLVDVHHLYSKVERLGIVTAVVNNPTCLVLLSNGIEVGIESRIAEDDIGTCVGVVVLGAERAVVLTESVPCAGIVPLAVIEGLL